MRDFPSTSAIDPKCSAAGRQARQVLQIKQSQLTLHLVGMAVDCEPLPAAIPPRLCKIEPNAAAAHAAARGQVFGPIVRHTWRITAFAKQPELAARAASALACMPPVFSYHCDQRSSAQSAKPGVIAAAGSKQ